VKAIRFQTVLSVAIPAVFLSLLTACSGSSARSNAAPAVAVQTVTAKVLPIANVIHAQGILYPIHQASLMPKITAPVEKFYVNLGSKVHRGELLAVLANQDLQGSVVAARGAWDQARANYEATTINALPEELLAAQAALANARSSLAEQQRLYRSESRLYNEGAIPRRQLDATAVALTAAKNTFRTAQKRLNNLKASGAQQQMQAAKGQMESAHGRYINAQAQLRYTEIRSPIDGYITFRSVYPGEIAPAGTPLLVVMDTSKVVLRLHIPETQAALLHIGDIATLDVPGVKNGIPAKVSIINSALDPNSTTVEIWLVADNPHHKLSPGASVGASIIVGRDSSALVVPQSAILVNDNGQAHVMIVGPGSLALLRPVVTGIRDNGLVQILSGIEAGDQVIVSGSYGLPNKTRVKPEPATAAGSSGGQD
jgi:multidrug efflux pump subunit AcrA (membrane-fusion protein)